jgi:hypothetical protein
MVYITLEDIGLFCLFMLASATLVYVILVLHQTLQAVCRIRSLLTTHDDAIRKSLVQLPTLLASLNELSLSLKQSADLAKHTLSSWQDEHVDTVDDLRNGLETIIMYSRAVAEVIRSVFAKA